MPIGRGRGGSLGTAVLDLTVEGSDYQQDLDRAERRTHRSISSMEKRTRQLGIAFTAAFAAGAAGAALFAKSAIDEFSSVEESVNAVNVTFEGYANSILEFSEDANTAVGLARSEFNQLATGIGAVLSNFGSTQEEAADQTLVLTQRAADLASVFDTDVAEAMSAINQAIRGETEAIRRFGGDVTDASVQQYLLAEGIDATVASMTQAEKAQARYRLLLEQTAKVQGDFANTSDSVANRQRILGARFQDIQADIGEHLIPIWNELLGVAVEFFDELETWLSENEDQIAEWGRESAEFVGDVLQAFKDLHEFFSENEAVIITSVGAIGIAISTALGPAGVAGAALAALVVLIREVKEAHEQELDEIKAKQREYIEESRTGLDLAGNKWLTLGKAISDSQRNTSQVIVDLRDHLADLDDTMGVGNTLIKLRTERIGQFGYAIQELTDDIVAHTDATEDAATSAGEWDRQLTTAERLMIRTAKAVAGMTLEFENLGESFGNETVLPILTDTRKLVEEFIALSAAAQAAILAMHVDPTELMADPDFINNIVRERAEQLRQIAIEQGWFDPAIGGGSTAGTAVAGGRRAGGGRGGPDFAARMLEHETDFYRKLRDLRTRFDRQVMDSETRLSEDLVDARNKRDDALEKLAERHGKTMAKIADKYDNTVADIHRKHAAKVESLTLSYTNRVVDINRRAAQRLRDIEIQTSYRIRQASAAHAERMTQIRLNMERQRLAVSLRFGRAQEDIERARQRTTEDLQRGFTRGLEMGGGDAAEAWRSRQQLLQGLEDLQIDSARDIEDAAIDHARGMQDVERTGANQLADARRQHHATIRGIDRQAQEAREAAERQHKRALFEAEMAHQQALELAATERDARIAEAQRTKDAEELLALGAFREHEELIQANFDEAQEQARADHLERLDDARLAYERSTEDAQTDFNDRMQDTLDAALAASEASIQGTYDSIVSRTRDMVDRVIEELRRFPTIDAVAGGVTGGSVPDNVASTVERNVRSGNGGVTNNFYGDTYGVDDLNDRINEGVLAGRRTGLG